MPLLLVGLGLGNEKDVTVAGLEAIRSADVVYLEAYTSVLGVKAEVLEEFYGCKIHISDRYEVESATDTMLDQAMGKGTVAFLVVGDPYCATTHTDLVLRARHRGIQVRVYHNASIMNAAGACGLHLYNFGRTISIPYFMEGSTDETKQTSYYDYLQFNDSGHLHTLCLLDIKVKEPNVEAARLGKIKYDPPRFMTVNQALEQLLECERIRGQGTWIKQFNDVAVLGWQSVGLGVGVVVLYFLQKPQMLFESFFSKPFPFSVAVAGCWLLVAGCGCFFLFLQV
tara:strand:- start:858 stop:1706 length:849 start_codon:yes stop_codon:yes gene_type:complete